MHWQSQQLPRNQADAAIRATTPSLPPEGGLLTAVGLEAFFPKARIRDVEALRTFLHALLTDSIARVELPMIRWAHGYASRNDARGLVELDEFFLALPLPQPLKTASLKVGRQQLRSFGTLKGHTFLRRYRESVETTPAAGQHVTVYGVFLHLFSIPLREGLAGHAYRSIEGFITAAARVVPMTEAQRRQLLEETCAKLPLRVERSLAVTRDDVLGWCSTASLPGSGC